MATFLAPPLFWDQVEPPPGNQPEGRAPHRCYSKQLKVDLFPGTFVVIAATPANASASRDVIVARIVKAVGGTSTRFFESEAPSIDEATDNDRCLPTSSK